MAARSAVRRENRLELEIEGFLAKTLNLNLLRAAKNTLVSQFCRTRVVCQRWGGNRQTDTQTHRMITVTLAHAPSVNDANLLAMLVVKRARCHFTKLCISGNSI